MKWFCFSDLCSHGPPAATVSSSLCRNDNAVLFGNKKVAARARKAPRWWGVWRRCLLSPVGRGLGRGHFSFWSSKSIVLLHFECCFVSSSTTDGLLWDDLSGSIAQGNRVKPQDLNGRSCFLSCRATNLQFCS